jgi:hypothetical protein
VTTTILPQGNYNSSDQSYTILLAVCVSDGLGAVSNTTIEIPVEPYQSSTLSEYFSLI